MRSPSLGRVFQCSPIAHETVSDENKMTISNSATVFAPSILRPPADADLRTLLSSTQTAASGSLFPYLMSHLRSCYHYG